MIEFLNDGKAIYVEGNDFFRDHNNTHLFSYFGCQYLSDGYRGGNIESVSGQPGTFVSDMEYAYPYHQKVDYSNDLITENGGTLLFLSQDGEGRVVSHQKADGYRVIASSLVFGALKDGNGINTKNELMSKYLEFLLPTRASADKTEGNSLPSLYKLFQNYPNPFNGITTIRFHLPASASVNLQIVDIRGRSIRTLVDGEMNGGTHTVQFDAYGMESGIYTIRLRADHFSVTKKMIYSK